MSSTLAAVSEVPGALIFTPVSIVLTGPCPRLFAPAVGFLSHNVTTAYLSLTFTCEPIAVGAFLVQSQFYQSAQEGNRHWPSSKPEFKRGVCKHEWGGQTNRAVFRASSMPLCSRPSNTSPTFWMIMIIAGKMEALQKGPNHLLPMKVTEDNFSL